jgi:hypothetical protein
MLVLMELAPFGGGLPAQPVLGLAPFLVGLGRFDGVQAAPDRAAVDAELKCQVADARAAAHAAANELDLMVAQL